MLGLAIQGHIKIFKVSDFEKVMVPIPNPHVIKNKKSYSTVNLL